MTLLPPTPHLQVNSNSTRSRTGSTIATGRCHRSPPPPQVRLAMCTGPQGSSQATASPPGALLMGEKGSLPQEASLESLENSVICLVLERGPAPATNSHPLPTWDASGVALLSTSKPWLTREPARPWDTLSRPGRKAALCLVSRLSTFRF